MAWNNLKDKRFLKGCTATSHSGSTSLNDATLTIIPLGRWHANNDTELFSFTEPGAIRIAEVGTYLFAGGVYMTTQGGSCGVDIAYTTTPGNTANLTRLYSAMYQSANGTGGGISLPAKCVRVTQPIDVYLRAWRNGGTSGKVTTNSSTNLTIIKLCN